MRSVEGVQAAGPLNGGGGPAEKQTQELARESGPDLAAMAAASGSTPGPPAVWAVTIQPPSAKHIGRGESEVAEPLATRQAPNGRGAARPAPASFLREGPALPSWSGDAAAAGPASPLGSNASPGMRPVASRSTLPNSASGFLQLPPRAGSANSQQARFARRLSDSKPAGGLHGADRELGLSSDCLGFLRFADEIVERAYQSYRADVSFPRHRLLVPLIFFAYFGAAMVFLGVTFSNEDSFREHDRSKRLVKIFVGFVPSLLFGLVNMFLLFRRPSFFKRHMQTLLTAATLFAVAFNAWPVLDFEHPQIIYFSCMWLIDIACRGGYLLSARAHMLVITCIAIVVWIAFPVSGAAHNLVDYLAQAVIAGMVVPASFFAVREDEVRRRSDFARNSSLHDEVRSDLPFQRSVSLAPVLASLRAVRVAHDDLRQRNAALRDQLTTLQREKIGADLDLDSPLAKALKALDAIRSDPRLAAQCEWAVAGLEGAITTLIASKSMCAVPPHPLPHPAVQRLALKLPGGADAEAAGGAHAGGRGRGGGGGGGAGSSPRKASVSGPGGLPGLVDSLAVPLPFFDAVEAEARRIVPLLTHWDDFDIYQVDHNSEGRPLLAMSMAIVEGLGLSRRLPIDVPRLASFVARVESGYGPHPYHNRIHAADVCQSMAVVLLRGGLVGYLSDVEQLAAYLACIVHDFEHPGLNNNYLINTGDPLAILYNDRSPLESHHVAASWRALRESEYNFLQAMPRPALKELRRTIIDMVLATDMSQHFEILGNFKKRASAGFLPAGMDPPPPASAAAPPGAPESPVVSSRPSRRHSGVEGGAASGPEGAGPESPASRPASRSSLATFRSGRQPQPQPQPQPHEAGAGALQRSPSPGRALRAPALGGGRKAGSSFRLVPTLPPPSLVQPEDRRLLLAMAIKACDIGHGAKPLPLHIEWSNRVSSEFYNQGDLERGQGLEVSPLMDRSTANLPRSQMGFFDFICLPSFEALSGILPPLKDVLVAGARRNYAHWQESALKTATP
eukprot:tig00000178_g12752.t1